MQQRSMTFLICLGEIMIKNEIPLTGLGMPHAARLARAQEKRVLVVNFLADEGWSSKGVIQELLGLSYPTTHALLKAMVAEGLLRQKTMFVPGRSGARQVMLYGITAHGLVAADCMENMRRQPWDAAKTSPLAVPHQLLTQQMRLKAERLGWMSWVPARRLIGLGLAKLPDAQAVTLEGMVVGIEIERHLKTPKRYEAVLGAYIYEIRNHGRWQRIDYICPDAKFAQRIATSFATLKQLRLEVKGLPSRSAPVEQAHLDRFRFYAQDAWPSGLFSVARRQA